MKWFVVLFIATLSVSFLWDQEIEGHDRVTTSITWSREISRIVFDRCASCHRGGDTSFSFMTYAEARPWAIAIKEEVLARRMPPWGGIKGFGEFRNDQALTAEQIEMILEWVDGGLPEGNPRDVPPLRDFPSSYGEPTSGQGIAVSGDFSLKNAFSLDGIWPEKVSEDASFQITAELPDGRIVPLLWLYEYKTKYSHPFLLQTPVDLPAGTLIRGVPSESTVRLLPVVPAGQ